MAIHGIIAYHDLFNRHDERVAALRPFDVDRAADGVGLRRAAVEAGPEAGNGLVGRRLEVAGGGVPRLDLEGLAGPDAQQRFVSQSKAYLRARSRGMRCMSVPRLPSGEGCRQLVWSPLKSGGMMGSCGPAAPRPQPGPRRRPDGHRPRPAPPAGRPGRPPPGHVDATAERLGLVCLSRAVFTLRRIPRLRGPRGTSRGTRPVPIIVRRGVYLDMSNEEAEAHVAVKDRGNPRCSRNLTAGTETGHGVCYADGVRVTHAAADLSSNPDGTFLTGESFESGRVRLIPASHPGSGMARNRRGRQRTVSGSGR